MTLKEKFKQWLDTDPRVQIREVQLEVIADEFAIEFGKWIINDAFAYNTYLYTIQDLKELLEIYKKEKGL